MRKVLGYVLVGLAVFSLALAALMRFYVPSHAKKTPLDLNVTLYGDGSGKLFNPATNKVADVTIRSVRHVRVDSSASSDKLVVLNQGLCIFVDSSRSKTCPAVNSPTLVSVVTERIISDRVSGASISGKGSTLDGDSVEHKGLTLRFPFDTKKKTYQFWDYNVKTSRPAVYQGEETVSGLTAYRFAVSTPKTKAEIVLGTSGYYTDTRTLWVEPDTGVILKADDHQIKTFSNGSVAADLVIKTAPESVKTEVDTANKYRDQLKLLTVWLPLILLIIGVLLALAAVVVLRRNDGTNTTGGPAHARADRVPVGQL